ncbi:MAG: LysM domain-containing protein [Alphaproteobacteria bacterium]
MFLSNSRYAGLETVTTPGPDGQEVAAVKLRVVPETAGTPTLTRSGDKLDVMADRLYRDGTRGWRIADANSELEANALVARDGRVIAVPER